MRKFFVQIKGKQLGPFNGDELKQLVAIGRLSRTDYIRMDGKEGWILAEKIKDLGFSKKINTETEDSASEVIDQWLQENPDEVKTTEKGEISPQVTEEANIGDSAGKKPKLPVGANPERVKNLTNAPPQNVQQINSPLVWFLRQPLKGALLLIWVLRLEMVVAIYKALRCLEENGWKWDLENDFSLKIILSFFTACWIASEIVVLLRSSAKSLNDLRRMTNRFKT